MFSMTTIPLINGMDIDMVCRNAIESAIDYKKANVDMITAHKIYSDEFYELLWLISGTRTPIIYMKELKTIFADLFEIVFANIYSMYIDDKEAILSKWENLLQDGFIKIPLT